MIDPKSNLLDLKLQSSPSGRETDLHARLQKVTADISDINKALALFRILSTEYLRGIGAAHLSCVDGKLWTSKQTRINGQLTVEEIHDERTQTLCQKALAQNKQLRLAADTNSKFDLFLAPISAGEGNSLVLLVKRHSLEDGDAITAVMNMLRMIASAHELWFARAASLRQTELFEASAAVIELVSIVEQCETVQHACHAIAQQSKRYLNCLTTCVGVLRGSRYEVAANSETASFDRTSELFKLYENVWQEASLKQDMSIWPPGKNDTRHGLIQHRKLVEHLRLGAAISVPLKNENNKVIGVMTVAGNIDELSQNLSVNFLRCAGSRVGNAIELLSRAQEGPLRRLVASLKRTSGSRKMSIAMATIAISCAILLVPVPYRVRCQCETDAVARRYASAPFDGVIKQGFVRAGDLVEPGQMLAEMNGREIRQELARAVFDKHRAEKKRDLLLAEDNVAESLLAGMEAKSLTVSRDLLETKKANLKIVSPIEGVILNGDLDEAQDMPVQVGQTLFEIGSLNPIKIHVAIPADEIANIRDEMEVRVWLSGLGSKSLTGRIGNVLPDAEIRDSKNVFIAEVIVDNPDNLLRPGMRGTATVTSDAHSLGWNLFHKPWEYAASRLSW